ncbi:hypothetical protein D9619_002429 [Psilocybe cf. subviscida]|uniref:Uncharacterized protein n=1 Tax=Psilocybe cf. subviscida TaxID=2480587 RepID=A0A8H5ETX1_9AGAR|nr:hypothetical protein D9619_002429 [Psilocybe cf. subviscida]
MAPTPSPPSVKTITPAPKPRSSDVLVAFPAPHILQLTFNRPKTLNAMTPGMSDDMRRLLDWFESEAEMWCVCFPQHLLLCVISSFCMSSQVQAPSLRVIFGEVMLLSYRAQFLCPFTSLPACVMRVGQIMFAHASYVCFARILVLFRLSWSSFLPLSFFDFFFHIMISAQPTTGNFHA